MAESSESGSDDSENEAINLSLGDTSSYQKVELCPSTDIWQVHYSQSRKRPFYYNVLTKKSVWERPTHAFGPVKRHAIDTHTHQHKLKQPRIEPCLNERNASVAKIIKHTLANAAGVQPFVSTARKPWVIFDVNGTLASTTAQRQRRGEIELRPGVRHIQQLKPFYRVALWSSMGQRNMLIAVKTLVERGQIGHLDLVLDRRACKQAPREMRKNHWDTIKPLWERFGSFEPDGLARVVMVEDVASKMRPSERANLVHVPTWNHGPEDQVLPALVKGLLGISRALDLRRHTSTLSDSLFQLQTGARASGGKASEKGKA